MTRLAALAAVVLVFGSACGGSNASIHGGSGVVTAGRIGTLRIDVSNRADIVRFAGRPKVDVVDHTSWPGVPKYRALGYSCEDGDIDGNTDTGPRSGHLFCRTVYYVNSRTHHLVAFVTDSPDFRTTNGIRPGMAQKAADRREHQTPHGPWNAIGESSSGANLLLPSYLGKVEEFMLESRHHPIGLSFT